MVTRMGPTRNWTSGFDWMSVMGAFPGLLCEQFFGGEFAFAGPAFSEADAAASEGPVAFPGCACGAAARALVGSSFSVHWGITSGRVRCLLI